MRVVLKNRNLLAKLKQPLPLVAIAVAKAWKKKKSAFEPIVTLPTRKKLPNIENRSLNGFKLGINIGGKQGIDYKYQTLPKLIEEVLENWEGVEFDGKQIKLKKDEPK
jgi:hypothetical protein